MTSSTTTATAIRSNSPPCILPASLTPAPRQSSQIVRTYNYAHQLFLTKRAHEALEVLEPLVRPPGGSTGGQAAPIASASRGARLKVWGLYISILNAIAEMSSDDGKRTFGSARWKELVAKSRNGTIWDDVVRDGYAGNEGDVDADVVVHLATLLLAHATSQTSNQQRLETYLSTAPHPLADTTSSIDSVNILHEHGTSTPRELSTRLRILEIYTLHVLPRNDEWDYAREFINMSDLLDDERREAFLQALQSSRDEKNSDSKREQELQRQRKQQLADAKRREEEERKAEEARVKAEAAARAREQATSSPSESDYGVDKTRKRGQTSTAASVAGSTVSDDNRAAPASKPQRRSGAATRTPASTPAKKTKSPPPSFYKRASSMLAAMQHSVMAASQNLSANPMVLFRLVLFLVALLMAIGRRNVRARISQGAETAWTKIKRTVGMGVQVSYI